MKIIIKYSTLDYLQSVRFKLNSYIQEIKKTEYPTYIFLKIVSPLIVLSLTFMASVKKLKPEYTYNISENGIKRSHEGKTYFLPWSRFIGFLEIKNHILLEFINSNETIPSQLLFPNRSFNRSQIMLLKSYISHHKIPFGLRRLGTSDLQNSKD